MKTNRKEFLIRYENIIIPNTVQHKPTTDCTQHNTLRNMKWSIVHIMSTLY